MKREGAVTFNMWRLICEIKRKQYVALTENTVLGNTDRKYGIQEKEKAANYVEGKEGTADTP